MNHVLAGVVSWTRPRPPTRATEHFDSILVKLKAARIALHFESHDLLLFTHCIVVFLPTVAGRQASRQAGAGRPAGRLDEHVAAAIALNPRFAILPCDKVDDWGWRRRKGNGNALAAAAAVSSLGPVGSTLHCVDCGGEGETRSRRRTDQPTERAGAGGRTVPRCDRLSMSSQV